MLPERLAKLSQEIKHTILFIGPPPQAMRALGDKISSTIVAQSANVPTVSWSGNDVTVNSCEANNRGDLVSVPDSVYMRACVTDPAKGLLAAEKVRPLFPFYTSFILINDILDWVSHHD